MIKNDKQRDWDEADADAVDRSKLGVGNSAKHGSLKSSGEGEVASSKERQNWNLLRKTEMSTSRPNKL